MLRCLHSTLEKETFFNRFVLLKSYEQLILEAPRGKHQLDVHEALNLLCKVLKHYFISNIPLTQNDSPLTRYTEAIVRLKTWAVGDEFEVILLTCL